VTIRLKVNRKILRRALEEFPEEAYQIIRNEMLLGMREIAERIRTERLDGSPLKRRSSSLIRSFFHLVEGEALDGLTGTVFSTSRYARVHEEGRRITPVRAKYLTIPLPDALYPSGVPRYPVNYERGQTLRQVLDDEFIKTGVAKTHRGTLILWGQKRLGEEPQELFLLLKATEIPARMGATDLFQDHVHEMARRMSAELARVWKQRRQKPGKN